MSICHSFPSLFICIYESLGMHLLHCISINNVSIGIEMGRHWMVSLCFNQISSETKQSERAHLCCCAILMAHLYVVYPHLLTLTCLCVSLSLVMLFVQQLPQLSATFIVSAPVPSVPIPIPCCCLDYFSAAFCYVFTIRCGQKSLHHNPCQVSSSLFSARFWFNF